MGDKILNGIILGFSAGLGFALCQWLLTKV